MKSKQLLFAIFVVMLVCTISATAQAQPPVSDPDGPYVGNVGSPVTFDGSGSSDPDGTIVAYDWDFGDGGTGTGVNPTHTYAAPGTYTVTLTVSDDDGNTDSASTTATILDPPNLPPVSDPDGPYVETVGTPVTFDGSGSFDLDGTIISYEWDFGDGSTGTGVAPVYTYAAGGTYTVSLTVTDDAGATDTATTTADIAEVVNEPPVSDPDGPYVGTVGTPITFDGSASSDPDGTIVAYDWDFGDGGTGTGVNPTYTYAAAGTYTVTLTVTDDGGATDTATTTADIGEVVNNPPVSDPDGPYTGTVGVPVNFDGSASYDPDGDPLTYEWDFGDGSPSPVTGVSPTHTYATAGTYFVTLTVEDGRGAIATAITTAEIEVAVINPPVDIKPGSCPNAFNGKSKGVIPVAIVGTDDFDVTEVDPSTIKLTTPSGNVISPLDWRYDDSTEPVDDPDCETCFNADDNLIDTDGDGVPDTYPGDGYLDLVLLFDAQELAAAIGEADREECIPLTLTGEMMDGVPIEGSDFIVVKTKIK